MQGDENFRPVAFAQAPDGSLYFTDWVDKSYPVHGKGRIWRLSFREPPPEESVPPLTEIEQRARTAQTTIDWDALASNDPFLRQSAIAGLAKADELDQIAFETLRHHNQRLSLLQALRWRHDHSTAEPDPPPVELLRTALRDEDRNVRFYAVRWIADAQVKDLRDEVQQQLQQTVDLTPELFQATIAALELLDTGKTTFDPLNTAKYAAEIFTDEEQPNELRALALRMIPPNHPSLRLESLIDRDERAGSKLQREAVRTLVLSGRPDHQPLLAKAASAASLPEQARADAVLGLDPATTKQLLQRLSESDNAPGRAAGRKLAQDNPAAEYAHPAADDESAWMEMVGSGGNSDEGWRIFFGAGEAACAKCHRVQGRGASTGPDLTGIAARTSRWEVLQSMLQPSRDMAPRYVPTQLQLNDGRVLTGLWQGHDTAGKLETFQAADGTNFSIDPADVEVRQLSETSIMPVGLLKLLSPDDIRNLLQFLSEQ